MCGRGAAPQPSSLINEFLARTRSGCLHRGARGSAETPATRHVPPARTRSSRRRQGSPLHGTCDVGRRSRPDLPCAKPSPPLERGLARCKASSLLVVKPSTASTAAFRARGGGRASLALPMAPNSSNWAAATKRLRCPRDPCLQDRRGLLPGFHDAFSIKLQSSGCGGKARFSMAFPVWDHACKAIFLLDTRALLDDLAFCNASPTAAIVLSLL